MLEVRISKKYFHLDFYMALLINLDVKDRIAEGRDARYLTEGVGNILGTREIQKINRT